jgi:hypothetical protein
MRTLLFAATLTLLVWPAARAGYADDKPAKSAPALELKLERHSLENVADKAGLWQYEGGRVMQKRQHVANYASVKRVVKNGTDEQNTAMLTVTIFFLGKRPPENITLQGAHDFSSGGQAGSVSAASAQYSAYIGKSFARDGDTLTIK